MEIEKTYDVHTDSKKRITLRGSSYRYYRVTAFSDGSLMLEPRVLTDPNAVQSAAHRTTDAAKAQIKKTTPKRVLGIADGEFTIPDDIDADNEEIAKMFGIPA